jgi:hypothetical protein
MFDDIFGDTYKVTSSMMTCPRKLGPQSAAGKYDKGYCALWTLMYVIYRMLFPNLDGEEVARRMAEGTPKK